MLGTMRGKVSAKMWTRLSRETPFLKGSSAVEIIELEILTRQWPITSILNFSGKCLQIIYFIWYRKSILLEMDHAYAKIKYLDGGFGRIDDPSVTSTLGNWILVHSLSPGSVSPRLTTTDTLSSSSGSCVAADASRGGVSSNSNLSGVVELEFNVCIVPLLPCCRKKSITETEETKHFYNIFLHV